MNWKNPLSFIVLGSSLAVMACNSNEKKDTGGTSSSSTESNGSNASEASNPKGVGKFSNVELTHPLDEKMVASGQSIYNVKCESCHKLTDEKKVGPGWKGVTDRRTPEWILNFVTNTDEMIEKDAAAQKLLEECLVRMPNQSLADEDARNVLEFMRKNDGKN